MHESAMSNAKRFFEAYTPALTDTKNVTVVDIGAQDVNGSLREVCPSNFNYIGLDFQDAKGVDIVLDDPYIFPLENESADIVVSSSCLEHSEMFWLAYLEMMRILKPGGLLYLNVPSSGDFHRYPVDCWRFYPDAGAALVTWGKRNGLNNLLLESYTHLGGYYYDFVGVFLKDHSHVNSYPNRILDSNSDYENGTIYPKYEILNAKEASQERRKVNAISRICNGSLRVL
jgi:SAM-dependent methyltransferase